MSGQNMDRNTNQIEEEYEVQKVVDSKIENGQKLYLLKWKHYSSVHNSWVPENDVNCPELIFAFESRRMETILGANINAAGDIIYLVKLNKIDSIEEQSSQQVRRFWPGLLVNFLQSRVNWNPLSHALPGGNPIVETENPTGVPLRIIYMTDIRGGFQYLVEFQGQEFKFFRAKEAKRLFSDLIIEYLEPKLQLV